MPFENLLGHDLLKRMAADPEVEIVRARPETYVWRDGIDGRRHTYAPAFLAVMSDGSRVYRTVRSHTRLLGDPELSGRRARIELECAARGATFEIWTEREIRESTCGWPLLRVASLKETEYLERALRDEGEFGGRTVPGIVTRIAERLALSRPRHVGDAFLARSLLTGILMAVLCDLRADPGNGALIWKPAFRGS